MARTVAEIDAELVIVRAARIALIGGSPLQRLIVGGVDRTYMSPGEITNVIKDLVEERAFAVRAAGGCGAGVSVVRFQRPL